MRSVNVYEQQLSDAGSMMISASNYNISLTFRWPEAIQEQVDTVQRKLTDMSAGDPIIREDGTYDRTYDYCDYYNNIPAFGGGMEEWLEADPELPQSLKGIAAPTIYNVLTERKEFTKDAQAYLDDLLAMLVYTCVLEEGGETEVMSVRPGAYCKWRSSTWSLRFTADLETIGKDDLSKVMAEIITYEFV